MLFQVTEGKDEKMKIYQILFCLIFSVTSMACSSFDRQEKYIVAGSFINMVESTTGQCSELDRELQATFKVLESVSGSFDKEVTFTVCDHDGVNPFAHIDYEIGSKTLISDWLLFLKKNESGYVATQYSELLISKSGASAICPWNLKQFKNEKFNLVDIDFGNNYILDLTEKSEVLESLYKEHECYNVVDSKAYRVKGVYVKSLKVD